MMSAYSFVSTGKLKLKNNQGVTKIKKKKKRSHKKTNCEDSSVTDSEEYSGWWAIKNCEALTEVTTVAVEQTSRRFWRAFDDGSIRLGPLREDGLGPAPEEQFTLIRAADSGKLCFKTGYNRYIGVEQNGSLQAIAEALGARECFEFVVEGEESALCGANSLFVGVDPTLENPQITCNSPRVGESEKLVIRTDKLRVKVRKDTDVDAGDLKFCELSYVKKFQSFQSGRKVAQGDLDKLEKARSDGKLHEALLDRRSKLKADRYCKV